MATTTKYFKFTKVDADSGFSVLSYPSENQVFPSLPGLNVFFGEGQWFYGTAGSTAKENKANNIFLLTAEQMYEDVASRMDALKEKYRRNTLDEYAAISREIAEKNPEESSPVAAQRYADAKAYLADGTTSILLDSEVLQSGQTLEELCTQVVTSYEEYLTTCAKLNGLKSKIITRINEFSFSNETLIDDFLSWENKKEVIGNLDDHHILTMYLNGPAEKDEEGVVSIPYYVPNLRLRWEVL